MAIRLHVVEGPNAGTVYFLGDGESKVFGRSMTADVVVPDPLLSRHHVMVRGTPDGAVLLDLDSSNGTFVNGRLVREAHLAHGDRVKMGNVIFDASVDGRTASGERGPGDKVETVRALMFCSRCMRAVNVRATPTHPWEAFVCDGCRKGSSGFDPGAIPGYVLQRKLADDPHGPVYQAEQASLGRPAIVRIFAPSRGTVDSRALEQFLREATLAGRLAHPHLIETVDAGERNGIYFIVEERVTGRDLAETLRERKAPFPVEEALPIAQKVAAALEYLCAQGVVHRAVRPAAIHLGEYGVVKLGDLGLAKPIVNAPSQSAVATMSEWRGDANYLPPEQLASAASVDQRADVYALGATLYHMVAGAPPFDAPTPMRVVRRIGEGDLVPLAEVAPAVGKPLRAVIERCMEREPAKRYPAPHDLVLALEQARQKLGLPGGTGTSGRRPSRDG